MTAAWPVDPAERETMNRNGVTHDAGTRHAGRINARPAFDAAVTRREPQITNDDPHCNARLH